MQNVFNLKSYFKRRKIIYIVCAFLVIQVFLGVRISDIKLIPNKTSQTSTSSTKISLFVSEYSSSSNKIYQATTLNYTCNVPTETKDALKRATSLQCKKLLIDVSCKFQQKSLYPLTLEPTCPYLKKYKVLGCYKEPPNSPDITDYTTDFPKNSYSKCSNHCFNMQYTYAHLQNGNLCHCGFKFNSSGSVNFSDPSEAHLQCNKTRCQGSKDRTEYCGTPGSAVTISTGFLDKSKMNINTRAATFGPAHAGKIPAGTPKIRIVFTFVLNGRADRQVLRLLKSLYRPEHYYLIHIDARRKYLYNRLIQSFKTSFPYKQASPADLQFKNPNVLTFKSSDDPETDFYLPPNVRFLPHRFTPIWGGTSLLDVLLYSLDYLLRQDSYVKTHWKWDYFINLSESDFLVRPLNELVNFLTLNNATNFVKAHAAYSSTKFIQKQGLLYLFHECDNHLWRLAGKPLIQNIAFDGASDWLILTRHFGSYMVADGLIENPFNFAARENTSLTVITDIAKLDPLLANGFTPNDMELVKGLKDFYFQSLLPAESFFQTLLLNSRFCSNFVTNNLHHIKWRRPSGCTCEYKKFVDWCGCSPHNFRSSDAHRLLPEKRADEFIARKFESLIDQNIVKLVEEHVFEKTYTDIPNINGYWFNLYSLAYNDPDSEFFSHNNVIKLTYFDAFHRLTFTRLNSLRNTNNMNEEPPLSDRNMTKCFELKTHNTNIGVQDSIAKKDENFNDQIPLTSKYKYTITNKTLLKADLYNYNDDLNGLLLTYKTEYRPFILDESELVPNSQKFRDKFKYGLHKNRITNDYFISELYVRYAPPIIYGIPKFAQLFKRVQIGEKCDFKEQFFRNYGHMLSTRSDLRFLVEYASKVHEWFRANNHTSDENTDVTLFYAFVNPVGQIESIYRKTYACSPHHDEMSDKIEFIRKEHMLRNQTVVLPGLWTTFVIHVAQENTKPQELFHMPPPHKQNFNFVQQLGRHRRSKRHLLKNGINLVPGEINENLDNYDNINNDNIIQNIDSFMHKNPQNDTVKKYRILHEQKFILLPPPYPRNDQNTVSNVKIDSQGHTLDADFERYMGEYFVDPLLKIYSDEPHTSTDENIVKDKSVIAEIAQLLSLPDQFNHENIRKQIKSSSLVLHNHQNIKNAPKMPLDSANKDTTKSTTYSYSESLSDILVIANTEDLNIWIDHTVSWVWHVELAPTDNKSVQAKIEEEPFQNLCLVSPRQVNTVLERTLLINARYPEISNLSKLIKDKALMQCLFPTKNLENSFKDTSKELLYCDDAELRSTAAEAKDAAKLNVMQDETEENLMVKSTYSWSSYTYDPKSIVDFWGYHISLHSNQTNNSVQGA